MDHEAIVLGALYNDHHHSQQPSSWGEDESSIDFSALEEDQFPHKQPMFHDCSHADTLSTAGESSSWGSFTCEYHNECSASSSSADANDDTDDSESSLTLDDLKAFFVEDQVGIFNPTRDDLPPPKARTDYKGDSQNSFTLDDLALDFEDDEEEQGDNNGGDDSLGCLPAPSSRRASQRKKRKSSLLLLKQQQPKGILKNGSNNTRRSSSLTMLMMEDSSMFQLSLTGCLDSDDTNEEMDGWGLMQQSFGAEEALDFNLQALQEKRVVFSSVVVHLHPVVVGDNPSVTEGVPLMLDWKAQESTTYESVDDYEEKTAKPSPAPTTVRKLEAEERMFRLLNVGASLQDIQRAEALVNNTRQEREATRQSDLLLGHRTNFWKAIRQEEQEQEEREPELLGPPQPCRGGRKKSLNKEVLL